MKTVMSIVILSVLAGCAKMPKEEVMAVARGVDFGGMLLQEQPRYGYCFGFTSDEASVEIQKIWLDVVEKNPAVTDMSAGERGAYGRRVGAIVEAEYYKKYKEKFMVKRLSSVEMPECVKIFASPYAYVLAETEPPPPFVTSTNHVEAIKPANKFSKEIPDNIKKEIEQTTPEDGGEWIADNTSGCKVWNPKPEPNDSISWFGKCKEGKANGQGILQWYVNKSGLTEEKKLHATYEGYMNNGKENGNGTITRPDGAKYVGEFKDGKRHGNGTITLPDGAKYVGEFKDGKIDGSGTQTRPDGVKYVGDFKDGKRHGNGTETRPEGAKYVGEFKDGKPNGTGTLNFNDGTKYVGDFIDGKRHGNGTEISPDGVKYVGEFKDGKRQGTGTITRPDGAKYVGEIKNGKPDGNGTAMLPNGVKYVGEFKDGKKHGNGTGTSPDGTKHIGEFKDGKLIRQAATDASQTSKGEGIDAVMNILGAAIVGVNKGLDAEYERKLHKHERKQHARETTSDGGNFYNNRTYSIQTAETYHQPLNSSLSAPLVKNNNYESSFGNKYKYDLSNPSDKIMYSVDPAAQLMDGLYKPITPTVGLEESMGQHGGGLIP